MKIKMVVLATILLIITVIPPVGCAPKSTETVLLYHGQIDNVIKTKASFNFTPHIVITTPDGLLQLDSQSLLYLNNEGSVSFVQWNKTNDYSTPDITIEGEYWLYEITEKDYPYILSPKPVLNWGDQSDD